MEIRIAIFGMGGATWLLDYYPGKGMLRTSNSSLRDRLMACAIHLLLSLVIAAMAAALVFGMWYPQFYRELSGGRELFLLVVSVDVVLGPLITLIVFNRAKPRHELRRDLLVVALLQLAALTYGLWTVCVARPVHLVFEYDRFRVVHAIEVSANTQVDTQAPISALPLTGPTVLSLRRITNAKEKSDATLAELDGVEMATRPEYWQPFAPELPMALQAAKPVAELKQRFPDRAAEIDRLLADKGRAPQDVLYLPLVSRNLFWTAFIDPQSAELVATMALDPY